MKKGNRGFTLIELLVVIAIIAILSTVVMAGLNSARAKARDARRLSDVKQIQTALNLYYDSCGGYPNIATAAVIGGGTDGTANLRTNTAIGCPSGTTFGSFLATIPVNPLPNGEDYMYCSSDPTASSTACGSGSNGYVISFNLEEASGSLGSGDHIALPTGIQ